MVNATDVTTNLDDLFSKLPVREPENQSEVEYQQSLLAFYTENGEALRALSQMRDSQQRHTSSKFLNPAYQHFQHH